MANVDWLQAAGWRFGERCLGPLDGPGGDVEFAFLVCNHVFSGLK
jgi:hypothetical protein